MKKFLMILLAVLVLGACGTATMDAKKRTKRKARTTQVSRSLTRAYCKMVGRCNVRSGPGESYPVVASLPNGHMVFVIERRGDWYYINMYPDQDLPGVTMGWTHRQNLRYYAPDDIEY